MVRIPLLYSVSHTLSIVLCTGIGNRNLFLWGFPWNKICSGICRRKTVPVTLAQGGYVLVSIVTSQIFAQSQKKVDSELVWLATFCLGGSAYLYKTKVTQLELRQAGHICFPWFDLRGCSFRNLRLSKRVGCDFVCSFLCVFF